jgi:hypothetical protein
MTAFPHKYPKKKNTAHFIQLLDHILNISLSQGFVPNEMKITEIKPLFKSGNKHQVNNYRLISLLPAFSKIFEKCMASRLIEFITKHNLLYQYQFGFREMAIHLLIDKLTNAFDQNKVLVNVALDFSHCHFLSILIVLMSWATVTNKIFNPCS